MKTIKVFLNEYKESSLHYSSLADTIQIIAVSKKLQQQHGKHDFPKKTPKKLQGTPKKTPKKNSNFPRFSNSKAKVIPRVSKISKKKHFQKLQQKAHTNTSDSPTVPHLL
eukprot:TRINITY_DN7441_c0_g1_i1.p1 TRINITY_DN7441_c0_g1~~TRINITY_DN7441_c0_g1_i1.p1  ORF type:complete len:110 (+),score=18.40 TRINITY_DN7441_c0_g1_i1:391-720(+)